MFQYSNIHASSEGEFVRRGAELLERLITGAIAKRGQCILGLSGGSTPGPVYQQLGRSKAVEWSKVFLFLVDERYVPKDNPESNQRLVQQTLLAHANVPRANLVFPKTTLGIENCVSDYEDRLRSLLAEGPPDIVILGMGEDGHIASLFPGDRAALAEKQNIALHTQTDRFAVRDRITTTLPLLATARSMLFLLKDKGKKKVFEEMLSAPLNPIQCPAHALLQTGKTTWLTQW